MTEWGLVKRMESGDIGGYWLGKTAEKVGMVEGRVIVVAFRE